MHLEDVYIEGFKSFSERTSMGFQPGIGVIIGNNGVGKSNILDAIVWAMGENDLTKLRCLELRELFFSGSKDYPPADKIRVELNFKESTEKESPAIRLVREMKAVLTNTSKHCLIGGGDRFNIKKGMEIAAACVGGMDKLVERPIYTASFCANSPLTLNPDLTDPVIELARHRIPVMK